MLPVLLCFQIPLCLHAFSRQPLHSVPLVSFIGLETVVTAKQDESTENERQIELSVFQETGNNRWACSNCNGFFSLGPEDGAVPIRR